MKLGHVLQSSRTVKIDLNLHGAAELKRVARFWVGKEAGSFNKEKCIAALTRTMADGDSARSVLAGLTEKERQVLGIFARYGPTVSGSLLTAEVYARGIIPPPPQDRASDRGYQAYRNWRDLDPVPRLQERFILVGDRCDSYYWSYDRHRYPQLTVHPMLAPAVGVAPPVAWRASHACAEAVSTARRSSAQVGLDIGRVAEVLRSMGPWQTVKGDSPAKATRARLQKEVGLRDADKDRMSPPDAESFYYELLHSMDLLNIGGKRSWIREDALERHLQQPPAAQARQWMRAWLRMPLWQDGIGVVPDRESKFDSIRIDPSSLAHARELLVWGLCGVAHAPSCWMDLETFLRDLWQKTRETEINFYWGNYTWDPGFEMGKKRDQYPAGEQRTLAFLNNNVFLLPSSTAKIVALGFSGWTILDHEGKPEPSWTTDELGSVAPESRTSISQLRLARIADRTTTGWQMTAQSVARARLAGMTTEQILGWLGDHVKGGVPALLEVAVRNWTSRQGVQLRQVHMLRITQPNAQQALLHSPTFRPHLAGHIPPEWFLIHDDHLSEVRRLLETLGFVIAESMDAPPVGAIQNPAKDSPPAFPRIKTEKRF